MPLRSVPFPLLVFATVVGLYAHVRFLSDHDAAPLLELDNVHLAAYLERRLTAHGILVPVEQRHEAEALLLPEIEEAVRAF